MDTLNPRIDTVNAIADAVLPRAWGVVDLPGIVDAAQPRVGSRTSMAGYYDFVHFSGPIATATWDMLLAGWCSI